MPEIFYRVLHLTGILLTFMSIGAFVAVARMGDASDRSRRRLLSLLHGVGLLIVLVAGFGLLAKLELGFPNYIWLKLAVWLLLGAIIVVIVRVPRLAMVCWWIALALAALAGYLAWTKPF